MEKVIRIFCVTYLSRNFTYRNPNVIDRIFFHFEIEI